MQNPFKDGEAVLTKIKSKEVQATVTKTWKNEVEVRTADGALLWRTIYTVWRSGEAPLQRQISKGTTASEAESTSGDASPRSSSVARGKKSQKRQSRSSKSSHKGQR